MMNTVIRAFLVSSTPNAKEYNQAKIEHQYLFARNEPVVQKGENGA